ncbi:MAG: hypothetical protein ABTQ31_10125 [Rhizobiaceae bacterium]
MTPDFSPAMLKFFLRARAMHEGKPARARLRKAARVTVAEMDMAWMGRLERPDPRARLWGALGHVPADHGVMLNHGGQAHG